MKNMFLLLAFILMDNFAFAQTSGTIFYQEKSKLHFNIQGNAPPPANLPTERNAFSVLYFTPAATLYRNDPAKEEQPSLIEHESSDEGEGVHIRMDAPDNRFYCDLKNNKCTDQRDFMQRKFLIERDLKSTGWKLTGNQKMILNYSCQEATRQDDERKVTAWFTAAIPVSSGPASFCGLPGMVLEVNINDGDQVITATSVKADAMMESLIVKPKEGKKVTEEEFKKIREEKMKEMGVEGGGGNQVIIRINDR
ncbi:MAG: GLPGLI family protein [Chitinophagales bacterium]